MDGTKAIINKIIDNANSKSLSIISEAESIVEQKKSQAEDFAMEYSKAQLFVAQKEADEIVERSIIVAKLDVRKSLLAKKQELITKCFDLALAKLCKIDKDTYLKLIEKLIVKFADEGDVITLSIDNVISKHDVEKLEVFTRKNLTVSTKKGSFIGGIILSSNNCYKDLTFESIILEKREILASTISNKLFKVE